MEINEIEDKFNRLVFYHNVSLSVMIETGSPDYLKDTALRLEQMDSEIPELESEPYLGEVRDEIAEFWGKKAPLLVN